MAVPFSQNRRGMVYLDDSSSGEFAAPGQHSSTSYASTDIATHRPSDSPRNDRAAGSEDSYDEIYSSSDEDSYHSDCDDIAEYWDPYLYKLQLQAPKPSCIPCLKRVQSDRPPYYGPEYHSSITRDETARLLGEKDGNYLVRKGLSQSGSYSLSFVFEKQVRHYRLYFEDGYHYVGEKPFDTVEDLVQDGLITLYMEANNVEDYLQSARQTRIVHQTSINSTGDIMDLTPVQDGNGKVLNMQVEDLSLQPSHGRCRPRKPVYHPCTIPQRRDNVTLHEGEGEGEERLSSGEESKSTSSELFPSDLQDLQDLQAKERKGSTNYNYEKAHNFKLHNYMGINSWCDYCRNYMWGLRNQGFKCKDCGYNVHKQCKDETGLDCQPSHQLIKRVYGVELTTQVKMEGRKVPIVIKDCIEEVESRGLEVEGLYRMSGKKNEILRLKSKFDTDMCADLSKFEDVHALTGAMKLYLRELPIPLITFDVYDLCLIAIRMSSHEESLQMMKVALERLPPSHYNSLRYLMRHLHQVQLLKDQNRMDSKNLAVVFTPSLMRCPHIAADGIMAVKKLPEERRATELLIQHYNTLFT